MLARWPRIASVSEAPPTPEDMDWNISSGVFFMSMPSTWCCENLPMRSLQPTHIGAAIAALTDMATVLVAVRWQRAGSALQYIYAPCL